MSQNYNHSKIEKKWQDYWSKNKTFAATDDLSKKKYYCLIEFPYPSGEGLHVGHPRPYVGLDILANKRRLEGYNVLYPIGFDAFGLPSENYAIKTGIHPAIITEKNIKNFTRQLQSMGFSFDWDRQVVTTDPKYYKWTQWIFLKMFEAGLAYKDKIAINWCLNCKIGLANEEVVNGNCERCGGPVEQRLKEQWMLRITKYADRLIEDLDSVDYSERIKLQQVNWIGRSYGANIEFGIQNSEFRIKVFTTRPDTLFGVTYMVLAPEHQLVENFKSQISNLKEVEDYIKNTKSKTDLQRTDLAKEKTGVELKGIKAINPATKEEISVWIADYVLASYGTGAIMAVPAHDQRDFDFARKFNLPIKYVVIPCEWYYPDKDGDPIVVSSDFNQDKIVEQLKEVNGGIAYVGDGVIINSGQFNGLSIKEAIRKITIWLEEKNLGQKATQYKLRDWVFSRQRYWGEPIPMVNCAKCGWVPLPEKDLPLELPRVEKYQPTDTGESPLSLIKDWVKTACPQCGGPATRETDVMPNWAGSNWYFLRYTDSHNDQSLANRDKLAYWLPVDWYNGGMEHTTLHLLYSRFVYKVLYDLDIVPKQCGNEPYRKRTSHGLVLGQGGEKMSKSKGNVVNPNDVVKEHGADTMRLYEMFIGPFDQAIPWDEKGVVGVRRFIEKVWDIYHGKVKIIEETVDNNLLSLVHKTIKKVGDDIETQDYNTAVSAMMILVNKILAVGSINQFIADSLLLILAPFTPHICEEIWSLADNKDSIFTQKWPTYNDDLLQDLEIELVVQVNGKVRAKIKVSSDITEQLAEKIAREQENVSSYLVDKVVKNIIFVPGRLINFVV